MSRVAGDILDYSPKQWLKQDDNGRNSVSYTSPDGWEGADLADQSWKILH